MLLLHLLPDGAADGAASIPGGPLDPGGREPPASRGVERLPFPALHLTPSIIPLLPEGAAALSLRHCREAAVAIPEDRDPWNFQLPWVRAVLEMPRPTDDTALGTGR